MSSICTIREKELESVVNVAKLFVIAEHQSQGVSLSTFNGQRQWIFEGEVMDAMIIGGSANFAETFVLPLRLICDGEIQAHLGNESVELTISDDVARFTGTEGFSEMTLLSHVDTFKDFDRSDLTTATIRAYNLFHLINLGTALPTCPAGTPPRSPPTPCRRRLSPCGPGRGPRCRTASAHGGG